MHIIIRVSRKLLRMRKSVLTVTTILFVLFSSMIAYLLEPDTFTHWFNALYWVLTTMATVGYGDYFMESIPGKIFTIFLYIFGIGLLSLIIGKIIDSLGEYNRRKDAGKLAYTGKNHVIIINWSKKAQYAIDELFSSNPELDIIIIDELEKHPYDHPQVHYVNGDPTRDETLNQANVQQAQSAIIFADSRIDDASLVDGKSLLVASSIERLSDHVHTTVEIMLENHIKNFHHIHINEFVLSHDAISRLAVRSALNEGNNDIINQLLNRRYGEDLFPISLRPEWKTYGDAFQALLTMGATLISDRNDMTINRKLSEPIPADARLFVLCDDETYRHIKD
ncbi:potassium channel family protein [Paenibacillus wulumuqiensis]|uniref:potassium channel family protein n=1 Tax=Paenibacillus wulumuqiensis TaxID=1567107 RepID=UPI000619CDB5|nr:potassium channel family protein [Paenibacillus wulumuqiensis]